MPTYKKLGKLKKRLDSKKDTIKQLSLENATLKLRIIGLISERDSQIERNKKLTSELYDVASKLGEAKAEQQDSVGG